ncbi:hypothetical protein PsorP6_015161 [Peronosclerospora sorghi]|uniref:Uncharacterized protein n=1 Tax=Peronosclerospora sorghi TaxID=230839 RepID=A0ACC0VSU6_9STRA|nr:hypothetical protein PsorP6_015161 [Peronosclerospora sorghi]
MTVAYMDSAREEISLSASRPGPCGDNAFNTPKAVTASSREVRAFMRRSWDQVENFKVTDFKVNLRQTPEQLSSSVGDENASSL